MGGGKDKQAKDHGGEMPQGFGQPYGNPPQRNTPYVHPPAPVPSAYPFGVYPPQGNTPYAHQPAPVPSAYPSGVFPPQGNAPYVYPPAPVPSAYPSGVYPPPMPGVNPPAQGGHAQSKHNYLETLGSIYSQVQEFLPHHHNGHSHGSHLTLDAGVMANAAIRRAQESIERLGAVGCTTHEHKVSDNIGSSTTIDAKILADQRIIRASKSMDRLGVIGSTASDHRVPNNRMFMHYQNNMDTLGHIG